MGIFKIFSDFWFCAMVAVATYHKSLISSECKFFSLSLLKKKMNLKEETEQKRKLLSSRKHEKKNFTFKFFDKSEFCVVWCVYLI